MALPEATTLDSPSFGPDAGRRSDGLGPALADALTLTKPGIVRMVVITAGLGFAVRAIGAGMSTGELIVRLVACLVGVAAAAGSANALNQAAEWRRDALMDRTKARPIASGRRSAAFGWVLGLALAVLAGVVLWAGANTAAAATALATIAIYVGMYTPLKPVTPMATIVGAVPGALPPVIGWVSAAGGAGESAGFAALAELGGWSLFLIMLIWQMPHVMAIAFRHREDYARGGYAVLPVIEPSSTRAARSAVLWSALLVPAAVLPVFVMDGRVSGLLLVLTVPAAAAMLWASIGFARGRDERTALRLFLVSLLVLPVMLFGVVGDAALRAIF